MDNSRLYNSPLQHASTYCRISQPASPRTQLLSRVAWRRGVLAVLVASCLIWVLLVKWSGESPMLFAQQESPVTPTATSGSTPTPSVTPTKVKRVINEVRLPQSGDAVARRVQIVGTALIDAFHRYDIHIAPVDTEEWQWLTSNTEIVHDDVLLTFDSSEFSDGRYDLRVRAIDIAGDYTEFYVRNLEIRNANPPTPTPLPGATSPPTSPLDVPAPTPTPDPRRHGEQGAGFYAPDMGAVVRGTTPIVATVNGLRDNPFRRYELSISQAGLEKWETLQTGTEQAWQAPIYTWETTEFADGVYDLRLRIVYKDSNYSEFYLRNLSVANQGRPQLTFAPSVGVTKPRNGAIVRGIVEFQGNVPAVDLLRWELAWSPAERDAWQFLVSSSEPANGGTLARLDLSQLPSGVYDFRLRIVREDTNYIDTYVRGLRLLPK